MSSAGRTSPSRSRLLRWLALAAIVAAGIALAVLSTPGDDAAPPAPAAAPSAPVTLAPPPADAPMRLPPAAVAAPAAPAAPKPSADEPEQAPFPEGFTPQPVAAPNRLTLPTPMAGRAVRALAPELAKCFEQARAANPTLRGKVDLDFYAIPTPEGARAAEHGVVRTNLPDDVKACMRRAVGSATFTDLGEQHHPLRVRATLEFPIPDLQRTLGPHRATPLRAFGPQGAALLRPKPAPGALAR